MSKLSKGDLRAMSRWSLVPDEDRCPHSRQMIRRTACTICIGVEVERHVTPEAFAISATPVFERRPK